MSSYFTQAFSIELKESWLVFWKAFWKSTAVITVLLFIVSLLYFVRESGTMELKNPIFLIVLFGYCIATSGLVGLILGFFRLAWHIAGWWIIPIILFIPISYKLVFWLLQGTLRNEIETIKTILITRAASTDWLDFDIGPAARIGPVLLVIILPLLAGKALGVLFHPSVLYRVIVYILTVLFGLFITFLPSLGLTLIVFTLNIGRRIKNRFNQLKK